MTGKLGTSQDYSWLWEECFGFIDFSDDEIEAMVKQQAEVVFNYSSITFDYEEKYGEPMRMTFNEFLQHSDYSDALYSAKKESRRMRADRDAGLILEGVLTASEACEIYGLSEATVRQAINRGRIYARKSAGTWLILRVEAEKHWRK